MTPVAHASSTSGGITPELARLAELRRVNIGYTDAWGRRRQIGRDALVGVLRALGEPLERAADARAAVAAHEAEAIPGTPALVVAWDGLIGETDGASLAARRELRVHCEDGSVTELGSQPRRLPFGVHVIGEPDGGGGITVISAPRRARAVRPWSWGLFAPTYAIVDERPLAHGDLTSLEKLGKFAASNGAGYLVTLPLLATGSVRSPYSPLSRAFWEIDYLDLRRIPEIADEAERLPPATTARSPQGSALLALAAQRATAPNAPRHDAYQKYLRDRPEVASFARFLTQRDEPDEAGLEGRAAPHAFAQWATHAQLGEVAGSIAAAGARLVLDLPVSCRPDGYDPWVHASSFGTGATIGAPPDDFFSAGQNWGLAPLHPDGERAAGYPVVRAALANVASRADVIRIDHVAGWHRLWWIPSGAQAADGAYVSYRGEEMAALACLAAWRCNCSIVGEDLGTIDPRLRELLSDHGIAGMDVAVFDLASSPDAPLRPRSGSMATVDTHDTATVAGWLEGDDIRLRRQLGLLDEAAVAPARARRQQAVTSVVARLRAGEKLVDEPTAPDVAAALLEELGGSQAALVIANVEDLWGERDPQNVPGTVTEHVNFARPMALDLEQICADVRVTGALGRLDRARRTAAIEAAARDGAKPGELAEATGVTP